MFSENRIAQKEVHKKIKHPHSKVVHRKMDKARIMTEVTDLYLKGKNLREIGELYGVSAQQVYNWIALVREEWKENRVMNFSEMQQIELMKYDKIESELWKAWELSKEGIVKRTSGSLTRTGKMGGEETFAEEEVLESKGDIKYMEAILKVVAARVRLLGLDAPVKFEGLLSVKQETLLTKPDLTDEDRMKMFNTLMASLEQRQLKGEVLDEERLNDSRARDDVGANVIIYDQSGNGFRESDSVQDVGSQVG